MEANKAKNHHKAKVQGKRRLGEPALPQGMCPFQKKRVRGCSALRTHRDGEQTNPPRGVVGCRGSQCVREPKTGTFCQDSTPSSQILAGLRWSGVTTTSRHLSEINVHPPGEKMLSFHSSIGAVILIHHVCHSAKTCIQPGLREDEN